MVVPQNSQIPHYYTGAWWHLAANYVPPGDASNFGKIQNSLALVNPQHFQTHSPFPISHPNKHSNHQWYMRLV